MKIIRWGIIGCGNVCEVKSGPGFQQAHGSSLVAVMRRDAKLAEDFARRHQVPRWYDQADALIADPQVDAVYVATSPDMHLEYARRIAAAGKPAYIEKPMARSHAECVEMCRLFEQAKLPLFVAFYRRALPRFLKARELVQTGQLGTLTGVSYQLAGARHRRLDANNLEWRLQAQRSGGGLLLDLGSHTLDIIDFIAGPITAVQGMAANLASVYDVEDQVAMAMRFENGALGTASWNFAADQSIDQIIFRGTQGTVTLSTFGDEPVLLDTGKTQKTFDLPHPKHIQQPLIQSIVDQLLGRGQCASTGYTGARTAWVMDQALNSYYGGRGDAFWNRPMTWPGRRP